MTGFCLFYHRRSQDTNIISCPVHYFNIIHRNEDCEIFCKYNDYKLSITEKLSYSRESILLFSEMKTGLSDFVFYL